MYLIVKIFGVCLVVFASFFVGCYQSNKLYKRKEFYKSLLVFLNTFATHIRYEASDIFTLIDLSADNSGLACLKIEADLYSSFDSQWCNVIKKIPQTYSLNTDDFKLLADFGNELGKTDVEGQLKHIELYKTIFAKQLSCAEEDVRQKSKLYKVIGFFTGSAVALMIM